MIISMGIKTASGKISTAIYDETQQLKTNENRIHGFTDSVPVRKMHDCFKDTQKESTFHTYTSPMQAIPKTSV